MKDKQGVIVEVYFKPAFDKSFNKGTKHAYIGNMRDDYQVGDYVLIDNYYGLSLAMVANVYMGPLEKGKRIRFIKKIEIVEYFEKLAKEERVLAIKKELDALLLKVSDNEKEKFLNMFVPESRKLIKELKVLRGTDNEGGWYNG